jgi:hypothetical protein
MRPDETPQYLEKRSALGNSYGLCWNSMKINEESVDCVCADGPMEGICTFCVLLLGQREWTLDHNHIQPTVCKYLWSGLYVSSITLELKVSTTAEVHK